MEKIKTQIFDFYERLKCLHQRAQNLENLIALLRNLMKRLYLVLRNKEKSMQIPKYLLN